MSWDTRSDGCQSTARDFRSHVPECCDSEAPAWSGVKEGLCGGLPSFPGLQDSAVFLWGVG